MEKVRKQKNRPEVLQRNNIELGVSRIQYNCKYVRQTAKFIQPSVTDQKKKGSTRSLSSCPKGLKLKDYLYLNSINSKKTSLLKKVSLQSTSTIPSQSKIIQKQMSKSIIRQEKYGIKNQDIYEQIYKDMKEDVESILLVVKNISSLMNSKKNECELHDSDMISLYELRRTIKQKVLGELTTVEKYLKHKNENKINQKDKQTSGSQLNRKTIQSNLLDKKQQFSDQFSRRMSLKI